MRPGDVIKILKKQPPEDPTVKPMPSVKTVVASRVVVVEQVSYHQHGAGVLPIESRYSRPLQTHEQQYNRQMTVGEEWTLINPGWITQAGMMIIQNEEGHFRSVNPTEEERAEAMAKVVELVLFATPPPEKDRDMFSPSKPALVMPPPWLIPPRESMRGVPSDVGSIYVRCQKGQAKINVHLIPS